MNMLCSLTDVKTLLGIPAADTSKDEKLNLFIKMASAKIEGFLGYTLARGEYTEELHSVNHRQLLPLNHFPIQSVSAVTNGGEAITDYKVLPEYARWGRLYRGNGWGGAYYTRGFTHDVVSGAWDIVVSYVAGYYLPGDNGYVEGASNSLPYDIVSVCMDLVIQKYNLDAQGAIGLKAHSEGHISDTYGDEANDCGLSMSARALLAKYIYYGVA